VKGKLFWLYLALSSINEHLPFLVKLDMATGLESTVVFPAGVEAVAFHRDYAIALLDAT
jgi:hypothetical protein